METILTRKDAITLCGFSLVNVVDREHCNPTNRVTSVTCDL